MVKKNDGLVLNDMFWKWLSDASLKRAWGKEDDVWDNSESR